MRLTCTFAAAASLAVSIAHAATPAPIPHQEFVCVRGADERIIALYNQVNERSSTGCRVEYTKGGQTQILWSSQSSKGYCTGKLTQLATQPSQGNFHCAPRLIGAVEDSTP